MLSAVLTGRSKRKFELELAGRVLVIAVAHVEAERLAVLDHVEEHGTKLLELVDVVAVGLGRALGRRAVLGALHPHHLGLDPDQEAVAQLALELGHDALEVLARIGVEQLAGLGVVAVAVHARDARIPGQRGEGVEVRHRGELGLLWSEADVVAGAVGEEVGGGAVDELIAALGDLREEGGDDALAHHPAGDRDLLEEDVLDALALDPARDLLDPLAAAWLVAGLLERRRGRRRPGRLQYGLDGAAEARRSVRVDGDASLVTVGHAHSPVGRLGCESSADGAARLYPLWANWSIGASGARSPPRAARLRAIARRADRCCAAGRCPRSARPEPHPRCR